MRRGEGLNGLSAPRRATAVVLFVVSLGIVAGAQGDIQHRADSEVRGNRFVWRLVSLNAVGALAYFGWGRTSTAPSLPGSLSASLAAAGVADPASVRLPTSGADTPSRTRQRGQLASRPPRVSENDVPQRSQLSTRPPSLDDIASLPPFSG